MTDRTPTEVLANGAIRYGIYNADGTLNRYEYIKPEDVPTQEGTALNKENLFKDETAVGLGLPLTATPADGFTELGRRSNNSLLRDMKIMLNLSLGTSNIDAWADLLSDASRINTVESSGYILNGGSIFAITGTETISQLTGLAGYYYFGSVSSSCKKVGQTFAISATRLLSSISVSLAKVGSPTDNLVIKVVDVATYSTVYATSTNTIVGSSLTTSPAVKTFTFSNVQLNSGTQYAFYLERSGSTSDAGYYVTGQAGSSLYAGGMLTAYTYSNVWQTAASNDMYFQINMVSPSSAIVVWNAVTSSEVFTKMAVAAELTLGTGTITFYVSPDGTTWTQITALNAAQVVSFAGTSVYLKAVITGNTSLSSVAWGGQ